MLHSHESHIIKYNIKIHCCGVHKNPQHKIECRTNKAAFTHRLLSKTLLNILQWQRNFLSGQVVIHMSLLLRGMDLYEHRAFAARKDFVVMIVIDQRVNDQQLTSIHNKYYDLAASQLYRTRSRSLAPLIAD
jgi:hypothetical protein